MSCVIALGFFDGVHLGHGALLRRTSELAAGYGCKSVALTFDRSPGKDVRLLTSLADRESLIRTLYGIGEVLCLRFEDVRDIPWDAFVRSLQTDGGAVHLVCGWDYRFGKSAEGNTQRLQALCKELGLGCDVVPRQELDGITVSSSHIRTLVEAGDMEAASRFYGHAHLLSGTVQSGEHLGRRLGFPTANLIPAPELVLPRFGVYSALAQVGGERYRALCNVGVRPTVGGAYPTVESWLPDFSGDLYGKQLTVEFVEFLRPERKFESIEALKAQLRADRERVCQRGRFYLTQKCVK